MENEKNTAVAKTENKTSELAPRKSLELSNPDHISEFGLTLQRFIKEKNLSTKIQGNEYCNVDGWKFAGINFGLTAVAEEPVKMGEGKVLYIFYEKYVQLVNNKPVEKERVFYAGTNKDVAETIREKKTPSRVVLSEFFSYKCKCELISLSTGQKIGEGHAVCSNAEVKKATFDEYAIFSMAQTRAIGKAYRNHIGFIMSAAGFENTPAEEMDEKYVDVSTGEVVQELDITLLTEVSECKDLAALTKLWDDNQHLQNEKTFVDALAKRKKELVTPAKK